MIKYSKIILIVGFIILKSINCIANSANYIHLIQKSTDIIYGKVISSDSISYVVLIKNASKLYKKNDSIHFLKYTKSDTAQINLKLQTEYVLFIKEAFITDCFVLTDNEKNCLFQINENFINFNNNKIEVNEFINTIKQFISLRESIIIEVQKNSNVFSNLCDSNYVFNYLYNEIKTQYSKITYNQQSIPVAIIAPVKMNILYKDINNPIKIYVTGIDKSEYYITTSNGLLTYKNDEILINPDRGGKLFITIKNIQTDEIIYEEEFRVKTIPDAEISILGFRKPCEMERNQLINVKTLHCEIYDFDIDIFYEIISFKVLLIEPNGKREEYASKSNKFTNDMINAFKTCPENTKVIIYDAIYYGPETIRNTMALIFKIVDR